MLPRRTLTSQAGLSLYGSLTAPTRTGCPLSCPGTLPRMSVEARRWSRRTTLLAAVGLVGCGPAGYSLARRAGEDRAELQALLDDPMAAKDLLGLPLVSAHQTGRTRGLLKETPPVVRRVFAVEPDHAATRVGELRELAMRAGWKSAYSGPAVHTWHGQKRGQTCAIKAASDLSEVAVRLTVLDF